MSLRDLISAKAMPQQEIARQAGVANRMVQAVMKQEYAQNPYPSIDSSVCRPRQLRGYAESLTRLAKYLGANTEEVLAEYGINIEWPGIRQIVSTINGSKANHEIRIGILGSTPFLNKGEVPTASWAGRYLAALAGHVDPEIRIEPTEVTTVNDAIEGLLDNPPTLDAVFGVCDTGYRRQLGLKFINLPGIGIPISFLACGAMTVNDFKWQEILKNSLIKNKPLPPESFQFITIRDGIGDHLVRSIFHIVPRLREPKFDPISMAKSLLTIAGSCDTTIIFVADIFACQEVRDQLAIEAVQLDKETSDSKFFSLAKDTTHLESKGLAPVYPVGLACATDATSWSAEFTQSQTNEAFGSAAVLTSYLYLELITASKQLVPLPLEFVLPPVVSRWFLEQFVIISNSLRSEYSNDQMAIVDTFIAAWLKFGRF